MTDPIEEFLLKVYPLVTSLVTGAGGYWLVTEVMANPDSTVAMGVAFIAATSAFAGLINDRGK